MISKTAVKKIVKSKKFAVVLASVVSAVGGAAGGYYFAEKKMSAKYEDISKMEIQEAKLRYSQKYKDGEFSDPVTLAAKYNQDEDDPTEDEELETESMLQAMTILDTEQYRTPYDNPSAIKTEEVVEIKKTNIFKTYPPAPEPELGEFDQLSELEKKAAGKPYIVTQEEFEDNEDNRSESTLTWYEEDGQLVDEQDRQVPRIEGVIGGEHNLRWGYGSNDPSTVLIFNDLLNAALEIVRDSGSYEKKVLGINENRFERAERRTRRMSLED